MCLWMCFSKRCIKYMWRESQAGSSIQQPNWIPCAMISSGDGSASKSWDDYRRDARRLEQEIDMKLVSFSKIGNSLLRASQGFSHPETDPENPGAASSEHVCESMAMDIEALLERLYQLNDEMTQLTNSQPSPQHYLQLQRHREILHDYTKEFRKTRQDISKYKEHMELLRSVHNDIYGAKDSKDQYAKSRQESLLNERQALTSTTRLADSVVANALAAREALMGQGGMFSGIGKKIVTLGESMPGINVIIRRIQSKKQRDSLILGVVIAICLCILLYVMF